MRYKVDISEEVEEFIYVETDKYDDPYKVQLISQLEETIETLSMFPNMYKKAEKNELLRSFIIKNVIFLYTFKEEESAVYILRARFKRQKAILKVHI